MSGKSVDVIGISILVVVALGVVVLCVSNMRQGGGATAAPPQTCSAEAFAGAEGGVPAAMCMAEQADLPMAPVRLAGNVATTSPVVGAYSQARDAEDRNAMALAVGRPDEKQAKKFMAANQITNWAPGVADMPQRIQDANMHMDVLRRPIYDGVGNRAPFLLFHPPPPRHLPPKAPELLQLGFGISERLSNVYLPTDRPELMPTRTCTDPTTKEPFECQYDQGQFLA
jgi:hypothetical protein